MRITKIAASMMTLGMAVAPCAFATNGMNLSGYGPEAHAMGGASMAYDNGTAATMNNPATLGLMKEGSRVDVAMGGLFPDVTAKAPTMPDAKSDATAFYMPAIGYATKVGQFTYGVGVFSQGGMGTEYAASTFMAAGTPEKVRSEVGVGRFIVPLAYQMDDKVTIGGSLDFVWAGMDVKMGLTGAQFLDMVSSFGGTQTYGSASGALVNTLGAGFTPGGACGASACLSALNWARIDFSNDSAFTGQAKGNGFAFKLGGTYKVSPQLTLGAAFHSKTSLGDLSAPGASMSMSVTGVGVGGTATVPVTGIVSVHNFQWPQTIAFGMAFQATDELMVVADYKNIGWKAVMKNFSMTFTSDTLQANPIAQGFGMGGQSVDMTLNQNWDDQNVFQVGAAYKINPELTVRAGVNIANNPVPDKYMNPLFPAIAKSNLSAGFGYKVSQQSSIDASFAMVPKTSATNGSGVTVDFGGYSAQFLYSYLY